jgi:hypothetical protein
MLTDRLSARDVTESDVLELIAIRQEELPELEYKSEPPDQPMLLKTACVLTTAVALEFSLCDTNQQKPTAEVRHTLRRRVRPVRLSRHHYPIASVATRGVYVDSRCYGDVRWRKRPSDECA